MTSKQLNGVLGIIVVVLVGAVTYFILQYKDGASETSQSTNNNQVRTEQTVANNSPSEQSPGQESNRTPLDLDTASRLFNNICPRDLNGDLPNETITYSSSKRGLSIDLPYNKKWGNAKYQVVPYEETDVPEASENEYYQDHLSYGAMGAFEGGGCARTEYIYFLPVQTAQARIVQIKKTNTDLFADPKIGTINGLTVIRYESGGLCSYSVIEVIGKKYIYQLNHLCEDNFVPQEAAVKTIQLID